MRQPRTEPFGPIKLGLWTGRAQSKNVPVGRGGPTAYARRNIDDPMNAFMYLMDQVIQHTCTCTVAEARRWRGGLGMESCVREGEHAALIRFSKIIKISGKQRVGEYLPI